jgi:hypothetical protein
MKRRLRWSAAIILLVLSAIFVPVTLVARYAHGELLNTDRYVATVAPLASDPSVQAALTDRITAAVITQINVPALIRQATNQLNLKAAPAIGNLVSGPITDWLTSFVHKHVQQFVASPAFATLWTTVNRLAHQSVNRVLTGKQGGILAAIGDSIVLNIGPIIDAAKQALVANGFTLASRIPSTNVQFTLVQSDQLPKIQRYVRLLNALATWLPWITLLIFAAAMWAAPNRRRAAITGLVMAIVLLVIVLIGNQIARHVYTNQLIAAGRNVDAGLAIYNQLVHYLIAAAWTALAAGLVAAIWAWLAGPGRAGSALRSGTGRAWHGIAGQLDWRRSGVVGGVEAYRRWIYLILGVAGFVILLHNPTVVTVIWMTLVALLITAAVAIIHRLQPRTS